MWTRYNSFASHYMHNTTTNSTSPTQAIPFRLCQANPAFLTKGYHLHNLDRLYIIGNLPRPLLHRQHHLLPHQPVTDFTLLTSFMPGPSKPPTLRTQYTLHPTHTLPPTPGPSLHLTYLDAHFMLIMT